jgi:glycerol uptake facilitator-like aquaporin
MHSEGGFVKTIRDSILILIFEFIGTMLLTLLYACFTIQSLNSTDQGSGTLDFTGFLLGIFILLIFGAKISGSHYNPCVTLAFMLRRDTGKFSRALGLAYIVFQVGGAFCGSLIALMFTSWGGNLSIAANETIG